MKVLKASPRLKGSVVHVQESPTAPIIEAWTSADVETVASWPDHVVPDTFELRDKRDGGGKVLVERKGGGGGGWAQTREAAEFKNAAIERHQVASEDKVDRREALRLAIAYWGVEGAEQAAYPAVIGTAQHFYDWLRTSPAGGPPKSREAITDGVPTTEPAEAPRAGDSTSAAESADRSGEVGPHSASPEHPPDVIPSGGSGRVYPIDPAVCDHKRSGGGWVKWVKIAPDFDDRCPKCGTPKVSAVEGTTEDLGPAQGKGEG